MKISIVDYGIGNIGSVINMYKRLGIAAEQVSTPAEITTADKVLLPGVGAFDTAVTRLQELQLFGAVQEFAMSGKYLLGICLGMQLLLDRSEEGQRDGLGLISGSSQKFIPSPDFKVPHMGWNDLEIAREHPLFQHLEPDPRFYFVHSYHVVCDDPKNVLATSEYGEPFTAMIQKDNVLGAQFHPEKSHVYGMQLLRGFAEL